MISWFRADSAKHHEMKIDIRIAAQDCSFPLPILLTVSFPPVNLARKAQHSHSPSKTSLNEVVRDMAFWFA